MRIDPRARRFLDMLAAGARYGDGESIEERRNGYEALMRFSEMRGAGCEIEGRVAAAGERRVPVRIYTPKDTGVRRLPGLVYFHGGGLVAGSLDGYRGLCSALAAASLCRLVAVDYRLAPEHKFPAAVEDSLAATRWVLAHARELGIDRARIAIGGDSGGGTLAAVACQLMKSDQGPPLALQLLLCPVLDADPDTPSRRRLAEGHLLDRKTLRRDLAHYAGDGLDTADPRVSPLRAGSFEGLPKAIVHTAEFDPLRDEGEAYADKLRLAGIEVHYTCHAGMIHHFYGLASLIPYAREALARIGAEVREALG
jgi:acetyl esterase/lipase